MILHSVIHGEGSALVLLHGLFGMAANFGVVQRRLAATHRVIAFDLRNHGASPHDPAMSYSIMAGDVLDSLDALGVGQAAVLGHSMGGKVAMQLALRHPSLLRALVVVDAAPTAYPATGTRTDDPDEEVSPFADFITAMRAIDLGALRTREEADAALLQAVPSDAVRSFLLQSLVRDGATGWRWRLNLELLGRDLGALRAFPEPPPGATYAGPTLWIAGALSTYVLDQDRARMDELFPASRLVRVKNAGHWVHSEQPEVFLATVRQFLQSVEPLSQ